MDRIAELTLFPERRNGVISLIKKGTFRGIRYYIAFNESLGIPLAYIKIPKTHKLFGVDYNDIQLGKYSPNWGLTYSGERIHTILSSKKGWFLGWDYGHCTDYCRQKDGYINQGRVWDTEMIENECKEVIKGIRRRHSDGE